MIPDTAIEALKNISIVDVLSPYVKLKKAGVNMVGLCPLHDEKSPSFNVNETKGIFKCYGCGAGGDAISFIQKKEGLEFPDAVRLLCEKFDIPIEVDEKTDARHKVIKRLQMIMGWSADYYRQQFMGSVAEEYALGRGLSADILDRFGVGYTGGVMYGLRQHLDTLGVSADDTKGLSLVKSGGYDFFRNRIVFPVRDHLGYVIAFSARALHEGQAPKYINSSDTPLYSKSKNLYGLNLARPAISKEGYVIVVEGAPDVISMHQHGFENTVGTLGTSLTENHAVVIRRYCKHVMLMYDGDTAGLKAVFRAAGVLFAKGLFVRVCRLPDGHDPDTFVRANSKQEVFDYMKANSRDWIDFRLSLLEESVADKVVVAKEMKAMIMTFPDADSRQVMLHEYGKKFGMNYAMPVKKQVERKVLTADYHAVRVALMYGVDKLREFFADSRVLCYIANEQIRQLLARILEDNVSTLIELRQKAEDGLFQVAEACMDAYSSDIDADYDMQVVFCRLDLLMTTEFERRVKLGMEPGKLSEIRKLKKEIENDITELQNGRKN